MAVEIETLRADLRNDQRGTIHELAGVMIGAVATAAALVTATIALTEAFL